MSANRQRQPENAMIQFYPSTDTAVQDVESIWIRVLPKRTEQLFNRDLVQGLKYAETKKRESRVFIKGDLQEMIPEFV